MSYQKIPKKKYVFKQKWNGQLSEFASKIRNLFARRSEKSFLFLETVFFSLIKINLLFIFSLVLKNISLIIK